MNQGQGRHEHVHRRAEGQGVPRGQQEERVAGELHERDRVDLGRKVLNSLW